MGYDYKIKLIHDKEINQFIGIVPGLSGVHSQAPTLDELYSNLEDVMKLCLLEMTDKDKNSIIYNNLQS